MADWTIIATCKSKWEINTETEYKDITISVTGTQTDAEIEMWRLAEELREDVGNSISDGVAIDLYEKGKEDESKPAKEMWVKARSRYIEDNLEKAEEEISELKDLLFRIQEERLKPAYYAVIVEGGESPEDYYRDEIIFPSLEKANKFFDYKVAEAEVATGLDKEFVAKVMWLHDTYEDKYGAIRADCCVYDENGRWVKDKEGIREYCRKD